MLYLLILFFSEDWSQNWARAFSHLSVIANLTLCLMYELLDPPTLSICLWKPWFSLIPSEYQLSSHCAVLTSFLHTLTDVAYRCSILVFFFFFSLLSPGLNLSQQFHILEWGPHWFLIVLLYPLGTMMSNRHSWLRHQLPLCYWMALKKSRLPFKCLFFTGSDSKKAAFHIPYFSRLRLERASFTLDAPSFLPTELLFSPRQQASSCHLLIVNPFPFQWLPQGCLLTV